MRKLISGFLIAGLLLTPTKLDAWGFQGHEYIGEMTWNYLTPEARAWVQERMDIVGEDSLATMTTWADRVRGTEEGRWMGPLHFANVPPDEDYFDLERDCPNRRCVVGAAMNDIEVMLDPTRSAEEQARALRTFTHWITDMHQPLHMGYQHDRGGNDIRVTFFGSETNLHRLWDTVMIRGMDDMPSPAMQAQLHSLPEPRDDWHQALVDWANESSDLARANAYPNAEDGAALGERYFRQARPVVENQLILSAQRMARIINDAASRSESAQ
ncbi:S1/P1 nuclease [Aliidiomarina halalkaliphila]|nr:S1/P1 nuclease [Aliidiomarina halalkaliphila]